MIQDIFPKRLDNQYQAILPGLQDTIFLFAGSSILGKLGSGQIEYPSYSEFLSGAGKGSEIVDDYDFIYLLSIDGEKYFLALPKREILRGEFSSETLDETLHREYSSPLEGCEFIGVDVFRRALPKYRAFAAITAYHLYGWYRDTKYCGRCGAILEHDKRERMLHCTKCKNMVYPKISPAVIVAVTDKSRILLTKYAGRTYKNYALVAGFSEIGETYEDTVRREVMEEVGLQVKNIRYYKSQPWAPSASLLAGFYCELEGDDTIHLQEDELSVGKWVEAQDLELEDDGISLTREMILHFKDMVRNTERGKEERNSEV